MTTYCTGLWQKRTRRRKPQEGTRRRGRRRRRCNAHVPRSGRAAEEVSDVPVLANREHDQDAQDQGKDFATAPCCRPLLLRHFETWLTCCCPFEHALSRQIARPFVASCESLRDGYDMNYKEKVFLNDLLASCGLPVLGHDGNATQRGINDSAASAQRAPRPTGRLARAISRSIRSKRRRVSSLSWESGPISWTVVRCDDCGSMTKSEVGLL